MSVLQRLRRVAQLIAGFVLGGAVVAGITVGVPFCRSRHDEAAYALRVAIPSSGPALASAVFQTLGVTLQGGHAIKLIENGDVFDALIADIARARTSVNIVM